MELDLKAEFSEDFYMEPTKEWLITDLGLAEYQAVHRLQVNLVEARHSGLFGQDIVLMLEHPAIFTIGRRGDCQNLVISEQELGRKGIGMVQIERGGDITFHGPGQLVGYPILNLSAFKEDVHWYLRKLEDVIINTLKNNNIQGRRIPGLTGVWVGNNKICAIGLKVTRWISMHGFALNLPTDLVYLNNFVHGVITNKVTT